MEGLQVYQHLWSYLETSRFALSVGQEPCCHTRHHVCCRRHFVVSASVVQHLQHVACCNGPANGFGAAGVAAAVAAALQ